MRLFSLLAFALCFGFAAAPARAETYRLQYEAAVLGVVVLGTASYDVTASPSRYAVRANLRTSGLARLFDQTEIAAATVRSPETRTRLVALGAEPIGNTPREFSAFLRADFDKNGAIVRKAGMKAE